MPLIVVELRCWRGENEALLIPEIVIANDSLDLSDTPAAASTEERTEDDWQHDASDEAWAFKDAFVGWVTRNLGPVRVDYKPKSYVGVRVGRRTWAPLWLRQDGAALYLPDPDGARGDEPSLAYEQFEPRLRDAGIAASWFRTTTPKQTQYPFECAKPTSKKAWYRSFCEQATKSLRRGRKRGQSASGPGTSRKTRVDDRSSGLQLRLASFSAVCEGMVCP